jgi:AAHS family 4-hydroxybenzoate transporter-like MFS transporter
VTSRQVKIRLIPTYGWHSLFLLGGWSPLILMILVILVLPESYRFLIVKGCANHKSG